MACKGSIIGVVALACATAYFGTRSQQAPAAGIASRSVDRTFVCTPIAFGGVGDLDIYVTPPGDLNYSRPIVAHLIVRTGGSRPEDNLVFVRARPQVRYAGRTDPTAAGGPGGVFVHSRRCSATTTNVPLWSRGLPGPPIGFEKDLDCPIRGRVLIRVRATLRAPTEWRTRAIAPYAGARQTVDKASLAVRNQRTGAAIAYMELAKGGATRLWYGASCS